MNKNRKPIRGILKKAPEERKKEEDINKADIEPLIKKL